VTVKVLKSLGGGEDGTAAGAQRFLAEQLHGGRLRRSRDMLRPAGRPALAPAARFV
jgi:hypothetical protein